MRSSPANLQRMDTPVSNFVPPLIVPRSLFLHQNVLGDKGQRIRELTSVVQKRFDFAEGAVELHVNGVQNRGLCGLWGWEDSVPRQWGSVMGTWSRPVTLDRFTLILLFDTCLWGRELLEPINAQNYWKNATVTYLWEFVWDDLMPCLLTKTQLNSGKVSYHKSQVSSLAWRTCHDKLAVREEFF
jgi:hypothetical protein